MKQKNNPIVYCGLVMACLFAANALALETDADQPIMIDSNTATYDDAKAISTYTGNVISIQGSIKVNSDKLVVYFVNGEAERLVFTGNLAKFKQTPSPGADDVTGEASTGEYFPKKNLLVLTDNATVWQGNATYSSKLIEYDSKNAVVKAGEKSSDDKRVHVILKPKPKEQKVPKEPN
ncbi:MAG: lipopolysaccharide transport periplasmic protein LptA [Methylococcaceae bacterium]|jgi:lipopolysaccharide export system protein LptA